MINFYSVTDTFCFKPISKSEFVDFINRNDTYCVNRKDDLGINVYFKGTSILCAFCYC